MVINILLPKYWNMGLIVTLAIVLLHSEGLLHNILFLVGASSPEEIDESVIERYEAIAEHPLEINLSGREKLSRSGLLTRYQAASILDYRSRCGDILSLEELSMVDGFSEDYAKALSPFVSFSSRSAPGSLRDSLRIKGSIEGKASIKSGGRYSYGVKSKLSRGENFEAGIAARRSYEGEWKGSGNLTMSGRKWLGKAIIGDFNARFGQGAAQWSGFYMTSISALSSLVRRPTGISPVTSYSGDGTHRGVAAVFEGGRYSVSTFFSLEGLKEKMEGANMRITPYGGVDITYYGKKGECGISGLSKGVISTNGRWSSKGVDYYSELSYSFKGSSAAGIGGFSTRMGKYLKGGLRLRAFPSSYTGKKNGEYSSALSLEFSSGKYVPIKGRTGFGSSEISNTASVSVEASLLPIPSIDPERRMIKTVIIWKTRISPSFSIAFRGVDSRRTYDPKKRTDIRSDMMYSNGSISCCLRLNTVYTGIFSFLSYIEGGYVKDRFRVYGRAALFKADSWEGRLYCYERDAPGNFSVPAYYGTGYALSLFVGGPVGKGRLYLRLYGSNTKEKPGKAELKVQYVRSF